MKSELVRNGALLRVRGRRGCAGLRRYAVRPGTWEVPVSTATQEWCLAHGVQPLPRAVHKLATTPPAPPATLTSSISCLYPYQLEGLQRAVGTFKGRCLLADDMGLGKTVQAIAFIAHFGSPALVISPAFLVAQWTRTLASHGVTADVLSYDVARRGRAEGREWACIVLDEAHYIKERSSARTQALLPVLHECDNVLLCTGTPCPNRPEEMFTLLYALWPSVVGSFRSFAMRYCNARKTRFTPFDTSGASRREELAWLLQRAFMVRRLKKDVLGQLPPRVCSPVVIACDPRHVARIDELQEKFEDAVDNASSGSAKLAISELFRATCDAKIKSAVQYVQETAQHTVGALVVFAHHRKMLDALEQALSGRALVRIDGSTPMARRVEAVEQVQSGSAEVALLSMGAAGVGLTLTAANRVVFAEIPWTPATLRQCEDRVYRIGQNRSCYVTYLLCEDTLDTRVWGKLLKKERTAKVVLRAL